MHDALESSCGPATRVAWGVTGVSLRTTRPQWFEAMDEAWARPLPTGRRCAVDLVSGAFSDIAGSLSPPPLRRGDLGPRGEVSALADGDVRMVWDEVAGLVLAWDPESGKAVCLMAQPPDGYELVSPLRTLVHWVVVADGGVLLHGATAGRTGGPGTPRGVLILGEAGYGKSTTTLACLQSGWVTCGDDAVALIREGSRWIARSVYSAVKTKLGSEHTPQWDDEQIVTWEIAGTKRAHRLTDTGSGLLVDEMGIDALIVLDPTAEPHHEWTPVRCCPGPDTGCPLHRHPAAVRPGCRPPPRR